MRFSIVATYAFGLRLSTSRPSTISFTSRWAAFVASAPVPAPLPKAVRTTESITSVQDDATLSSKSTNCPFSLKEWKQRCQLAVAYRIAHMHGWDQNIFNHITLKVDASENLPDGPHFLLNDFGMGFDEVDATSLLKVTLNGEIVPSHSTKQEEAEGRIFKPGYVLHGAIHESRPDVHAIWHCHSPDTTAVCQTKFGLLPLSQEATYALNRGVSYHPFEGTANDENEKPRLVSNLGPTNEILMLENHGPLVATRTIEEAFATMHMLTRACTYQIRSLAAVAGDLDMLHVPSEEMQYEMVRRMEKFDEGTKDGEEHDTEGLMFACARRAAERAFGSENIYR